MTYLLSLPEDWKIYREEIVNHATDGMASLRSAINELIEFGYIVYKQERKPNGCFGDCIYQIVEKPICDFPQAVESKVDNQTLLNTNKQNTNNTNKTTGTSATVSNCDEKPTSEKVWEYYHENELDVSPERFWELNNKKHWKNGMSRHWKKAYSEMTSTPDEVYDPYLEYNPDNYSEYTGD